MTCFDNSLHFRTAFASLYGGPKVSAFAMASLSFARVLLTVLLGYLMLTSTEVNVAALLLLKGALSFAMGVNV